VPIPRHSSRGQVRRPARDPGARTTSSSSRSWRSSPAGTCSSRTSPASARRRSRIRSPRCSGGEFRRIQFTSDTLPGDITGVGILDGERGDFSFRQGPIFANVVLADEINRATPKTQSALLEAMNERKVTVDGVSHPLPSPFVVLATQNPHDFHGTFRSRTRSSTGS
jgi:hypothetical protein